ncbi:hypothetical protein [Paenibacillus tianjinensis]|uniref:Spo0E like sporulation regulatory protein n=1 Tax=Paenibacillus tianjinensis TaxID=2810347 RepID=A0ABX7L5S4_9BACL|nr:hypothetical protein [Paenibacillus tianjinensis]QSF43460.1 hypothetical protein JRJ22_19545 [Paenibacillus tianjinensis]
MFPINLEIYKEVLDIVASGDYTYSDLLELRDKTKDILDYVEKKMDEE